MGVAWGGNNLRDFKAGSHQIVRLMAEGQQVWPTLISSRGFRILINGTQVSNQRKYATIADISFYDVSGNRVGHHGDPDFYGAGCSSNYSTAIADHGYDTDVNTYWMADERHGTAPDLFGFQDQGFVITPAKFTITARNSLQFIGRCPTQFEIYSMRASHNLAWDFVKSYVVTAWWTPGETKTFYL